MEPNLVECYIIVSVPVKNRPLQYHDVLKAVVDTNLGEVVAYQFRGAHWPEVTARECAKRWAKEDGIPVYKGPVHFVGGYDACELQQF